MFVNINATVKLREDVPGHQYGGVLNWLGVDHHLMLLRVKEESDGDLIEPLDEAPAQVMERFDAMQEFYDGAYYPVQVGGLPGRYVLFVFPFAD